MLVIKQPALPESSAFIRYWQPENIYITPYLMGQCSFISAISMFLVVFSSISGIRDSFTNYQRLCRPCCMSIASENVLYSFLGTFNFFRCGKLWKQGSDALHPKIDGLWAQEKSTWYCSASNRGILSSTHSSLNQTTVHTHQDFIFLHMLWGWRLWIMAHMT